MRDPMTWSLPLYRLRGITVKVHLFFFLITIPVFLRLLFDAKGLIPWFDLFMLTVGILFISVLLHEYGHCFSARAVGGSADQILLWPLGGLAYVDVPHSPRVHFWVTLWGPLVNAFLCLACSVIMLAGNYSPLGALNPFNNPYSTPTYCLGDGQTHTTRYYLPPVLTPAENVPPAGAAIERVDKTTAPGWLTWTWRVCWINWWLFLFNMLLPAYPMDCGRLLHCAVWARTGDYRRATVIGCYTGYGVSLLLIMLSIAVNEVLLLGLGAFILINCYRTLATEHDGENSLGYDFSQGYTSLEKDEPPPKAARRQSPLKRWLQARQIRKLRAEHEQHAADEARMDELLDKIARHGQHSLTDEETRFMKRFSDRLRNRPS